MTEEIIKTTEETAQASGQEHGEAQAMNFSMFILSLSTSALVSLGVIENPVTKKNEKDLAAARQTIDLIGMLREKTAGNLAEDEQKLIDEVLTELRLWYCRVTA